MDFPPKHKKFGKNEKTSLAASAGEVFSLEKVVYLSSHPCEDFDTSVPETYLCKMLAIKVW